MADDDFVDPLRDPRIPDRPQSAEFWKLSEIVLKHDGASQEGEDVESVIHRYINDDEALTYMAMQRAARMTQDPEMRFLLAAIWIDGFLVGADFAKEAPE